MQQSDAVLRERWSPGPSLATTPNSASSALILGQYIPALDGLRGLAILLVMGYHFGQDADGGGTALGPFLSPVFGVGYHGVDLFFVLSGFLITGILLDMKDRPRYFRNFYIRRILRIFPLYYAVLFCLLVLLPLLVTPPVFPFAEAQRRQAWLWLYASNIYHAWTGHWRLTGFSHLWSLAVEEHFYLIWPVVIFFCRARGALVVSAACLVASLACR